MMFPPHKPDHVLVLLLKNSKAACSSMRKCQLTTWFTRFFMSCPLFITPAPCFPAHASHLFGFCLQFSLGQEHSHPNSHLSLAQVLIVRFLGHFLCEGFSLAYIQVKYIFRWSSSPPVSPPS